MKKPNKNSASVALRVAVSRDMLEKLTARANKESRKISALVRLILEQALKK